MVTIYGTRFCPYCIAARRFLNDRGIVFEDIALDGNPVLRKEIMARSGRRTVPQIWIGEMHAGGYDDLRRLDRSGQLDGMLVQASQNQGT